MRTRPTRRRSSSRCVKSPNSAYSSRTVGSSNRTVRSSAHVTTASVSHGRARRTPARRGVDARSRATGSKPPELGVPEVVEVVGEELGCRSAVRDSRVVGAAVVRMRRRRGARSLWKLELVRHEASAGRRATRRTGPGRRRSRPGRRRPGRTPSRGRRGRTGWCPPGRARSAWRSDRRGRRRRRAAAAPTRLDRPGRSRHRRSSRPAAR